jgi:methylase of polypeptide subunit release factors
MASRTRVEFGDWQTPDELANEVVAHVLPQLGFIPRTILEPTCGKGAFLVAAHRKIPKANLSGYEVNPEYVAIVSSRLEKAGPTIHQANFFAVDWEREIGAMQGPILVIGNPPWVTSAGLGAIDSENLPQKQNFKGLSGLDAMTGKSNFDVSEWMILRLIKALCGHEATLAMLCKIRGGTTSRRILRQT